MVLSSSYVNTPYFIWSYSKGWTNGIEEKPPTLRPFYSLARARQFGKLLHELKNYFGENWDSDAL